jgi:hypothetical protein
MSMLMKASMTLMFLRLDKSMVVFFEDTHFMFQSIAFWIVRGQKICMI